jgi:predicted nucleotidyltransferase
MAKTRTEVIAAVRRYVRELEHLGVPVERVILYGSYGQGKANEESDIDLAVFSEAFGPSDHAEFSGILSEAKWNTEPMIEAMGFHPSVLENVKPISFIHEIIRTGKVVYRRPSRRRISMEQVA